MAEGRGDTSQIDHNGAPLDDLIDTLTGGTLGRVRYAWQTATGVADPGAGNIRYNSGVIGSVTSLIVSQTDKAALDQAGWFGTFDDSSSTVKGQITITNDFGGAALSNVFNVTGAPTDAGAYWTIPVAYVQGSLPAAGNTSVVLSFVRTGDSGDVSQVLTISATATLTSNQARGLVRIDATSGAVVATLPDPSTLANGTRVKFEKVDSSANRATIQFHGAATDRAWLRTQYDTFTVIVVSGAWVVEDYRIAPVETLVTASGTYTKPPLLARLGLLLVGGGGGGGSGRRGAAGTVRGGGVGGAAPSIIQDFVPASALPASRAYAIGAGGAGGAAVTANDTNGNPGGTGGSTSFGLNDDTYYRVSYGGRSGAGGTATTNTPVAPTIYAFSAGTGGTPSATGGVGGTGGTGYAMGAGAGGGITTGDAYSAGGDGRTSSNGFTGVILGGAAGTAGTAGAAGNPTPTRTTFVPPAGAAGGGSGGTGGGAGGAGAGFGAPGGGGGASLNGASSGAGGAGGAGCIVFVEIF